MSSTLTLPPHFLTAVTLHDRGRRETGGWLLARRESPHEVVFASGPGYDADHAPDSVAIERKGVDEAAAAAGFVLCGDWHTHPPGPHGMEPSPEDRDAWRHELRKSPGLDTWHGVIVLRAPGRSEAMAAWATRRSGACEPVPLPAITEQTRTLARSLSYAMARGPLVGPPPKWEPALIRRELDRIDVELEAEERFRLNETNERLRRLGIKADLAAGAVEAQARPPAQPDHAATGDDPPQPQPGRGATRVVEKRA